MLCYPNAKINLGLNVIARRPDGFHDIESVLFHIPLYDVLEFKPANTFHLHNYGIEIPSPKEEHLLYRTWNLMQQRFKVPPLEIHLLKHIPILSGLGGGSADAAFLIRQINDLFKLNISVPKMKELAAEIGSDCPFFIENEPAFVQGRGEKITPVDVNLSGIYLVLVYAQEGILTKNAFSMIKPHLPDQSLLKVIHQPLETWKYELKNMFEQPLFKIYPQLEKTKSQLYERGAVYASMTGSGTTIFGLFTSIPILKKTKFLQNFTILAIS